MSSVLQERLGGNALSKSQSPYLLQHAHDPVDWMPWDTPAFDLSKATDKPIFLSIGYSSCHWCHVMQHESFASVEIADLLNSKFVSIKVDREERPDVDAVYMTFVQATTGSGGWPMSVFLTPDLKPFMGGTYFPPIDAHGRIGFTNLLKKINKLWTDDRNSLLESANRVMNILCGIQAPDDDPSIQDQRAAAVAAMNTCGKFFKSRFDDDQGGFSQAPKFPRPVELAFLSQALGSATIEQDLRKDCRAMLNHTLKRMAHGGIFDHIGGGFCRYSVDECWHVPHFEKMLYDNAQLILVFSDAFQREKDPFYKEIAERTISYVVRVMMHEGGGFYSAEDADSLPPGASQNEHKKEGAFYLWSKEEVLEVLGEDAGKVFCEHYYVLDSTNAILSPRSDPHGEFEGMNILIERHLDQLERTADSLGMSTDEAKSSLETSRSKLYARRCLRPRPFLDDKIIVAWNGLMISALCRAHRAIHVPLSNSRYLDLAIHAAEFIKANLLTPAGMLVRSFRNNQSDVNGFADDYANLICGCIDLFMETLDKKWLSWAIDLQNLQCELFFDSKNGGFYSTTGEDASILLRLKDTYDGAEPSPNSISLFNLIRIAWLTEDPKWDEHARSLLAFLLPTLTKAPYALPFACVAADMLIGPSRTIVLTGDSNDTAFQNISREILSANLVNALVLIAPTNVDLGSLSKLVPALAGKEARGGSPTLYMCENFMCRPAIVNIEAMIHAIQSLHCL